MRVHCIVPTSLFVGLLFGTVIQRQESFAQVCPGISFAPPRTFNVASNAYSVATGDFNGDGKPDFAVSSYGSNTISITLGGVDGTFSSPIQYVTGTNPVSIVVADLNGDGKPDLAVANQGLYLS